ncbi:transcriptional regulator [Escherichia marmotae]|uniref:winged helix-turn-helix domain-containing protein n=1 Tax=Escherichia marmotae TaxID=1499973 RepID=UPI001E54D4D5|nr:transcriptional regulator [Escherichia marmotae]MED0633941.1 transcriptional regulator [Escherichia marmotae]
MYWIINNNIEFWPEHRKLISVHDAELNVVLTTPASRCLSLLLEAFPDVVAQQDFFSRVWEEEGMRVPVNTLYQNISIIRRGFRAVGETTHSLIATVPRKGFKINNDINIGSHTLPSSVDVQKNNSPHSLNVTDELRDINVAPDNHVRNILWRSKFYLPMLSAFGVGLLTAFLLWNNSQPRSFFKDYRTVAQINGCHFNVAEDSIDGLKDFDKYKNPILGSGIDCKKYPWLYFSLSRSSPGLIVMACKKNYSNNEVAGCLTLSYREVNRDSL